MSEFQSRIERKQLADLVPASYNPRTITEDAFSGLGESLNRFGILAHIIWNERTKNIVGGHQRYKKLMELGETETDVLVVDIHPSEEVALNIVLNSRHIKGDFSQGAIEALRVAEVKVGQIFSDLKLDTLLAELEKKVKKPKSDKPKNDWVDADNLNESTEQIEPIIVCPKCNSKFRLKDNSIVYDATLEKKEESKDND